MRLNKALLGERLLSLVKAAHDGGVAKETVTELVRHRRRKSSNQNGVQNGVLLTDPPRQHDTGSQVDVRVTAWNIVGFVVQFVVGCAVSVAIVYTYMYAHNHEDECILTTPDFVKKAMRPIQSCACAGTSEIREVTSMSREEFGEKHAYTSVPLVVRGGAAGWPAMRILNYHFFKELYTDTPSMMTMVEDYCVYFRYGTDLEGLEDLFNMTESRVNNEPGQATWYVAWCDAISTVKNEVKRHFTWPEFLPVGLRGHVLWVWLGWPGRGANLHIDYVNRPAWQAQLAGIKTWRLLPPVECMSVCHELNFTLYPGDILTADGDNWYHATQIHGDNMTLGIGAEY